MAQTFLTIQEAAKLSGKSIQTIRRAVKSKKLNARKKKTPQGYNYMIDKDALVVAYNLVISEQKEEKKKKKKISETPRKLAEKGATAEDMKMFKDTVQKLMDQNEKDKENFFRLIKTFQDRVVALENQVKLLQEPPKKKWYQVWK